MIKTIVKKGYAIAIGDKLVEVVIADILYYKGVKYAAIYPRYSKGNKKEVQFERLVRIGKAAFMNWNPPVDVEQDDHEESVLGTILGWIINIIFGIIKGIFTAIILIVWLFLKFMGVIIRIGIIRW